MSSKQLFSQVTELTGLPEELIGPELKSLLERKGVSPEQMTLDSLRDALADYLTQVIQEMEHDSVLSVDEEISELKATSLSEEVRKAPTQ